jgi:predicted aspartyl protease
MWGLVLLEIFWAAPKIAAGELRGRTQLFKELGYKMVSLRRTGENHLFVFGRVEDRKRSCLIDTGWSYTTISTNTAQELSDTNVLGRLMLGGIELTNVPVLVRDLRVNGQPTSYNVVLGCDFLVRHQAIVDCGNDKLYLRVTEAGSGGPAKLEAVLQQAGWIGIKLILRSPDALTCEARINDRPTELLVDSGAMWSCLDQEFANAISLRTVVSPLRLAGPATSQRRTYAVADLKSWQLGHITMKERTVAVLELATWGLGKNGHLFPDVTGILGGADLRSTEALIDCGTRKLWVRQGR